MEEFDREGLPLVILANWRGFSGGQRDLFDGILQVRGTLCCAGWGWGRVTPLAAAARVNGGGCVLEDPGWQWSSHFRMPIPRPPPAQTCIELASAARVSCLCLHTKCPHGCCCKRSTLCRPAP